MILVDLNQVLIAGMMTQINKSKNKTIEEGLIKHMALNILRNHIKTFRKTYGEVVLCCDNRKYWRKDIFPYYKAGRKKNREKSDLDWHLIFDILGRFKNELKEHFPYKVIDVEGAEADDVIGTLAPRHVAHENVLILSSDGDFLQLQQYNNAKYQIKQYNPTAKKYIISNDPHKDLKEKIIRGDAGDGIPNVLSASDSFVNSIKQKSITEPKLQVMMNEDWNDWDNEYAKINFDRNRRLIDLSFIPAELKQEIINTYEEFKPSPKNKLLDYFISNKLMNLMDVIEDF
jgi:5'-3' exonuclease